MLCTQNILVEQFNFDHVAFAESCYFRCSDFCSIYFTKCCVRIACTVPAWRFSNMNFAIFFGIFRSWPNEKHSLMTTLSLTLFIIDISRATAMFLSSLNRFQMFSSRFRLTGAQNKCPSIPQNYFDRLFHKGAKIVQKLPL